MTIGERIRLLRKTIDLNQTEFGSAIGLRQTAIGLYETNQRSVSPQTVMLICSKFNVNEEWLIDGKGEMFAEKNEAVVDQLLQEYDLDNLDKKILLAYLQLNDFQRKAIKDFVYALVDSIMPDGDYEEYREEYIEDRGTIAAARHGDADSMEELADKFDSISGEDK